MPDGQTAKRFPNPDGLPRQAGRQPVRPTRHAPIAPLRIPKGKQLVITEIWRLTGRGIPDQRHIVVAEGTNRRDCGETRRSEAVPAPNLPEGSAAAAMETPLLPPESQISGPCRADDESRLEIIMRLCRCATARLPCSQSRDASVSADKRWTSCTGKADLARALASPVGERAYGGMGVSGCRRGQADGWMVLVARVVVAGSGVLRLSVSTASSATSNKHFGCYGLG